MTHREKIEAAIKVLRDLIEAAGDDVPASIIVVTYEGGETWNSDVSIAGEGPVLSAAVACVLDSVEKLDSIAAIAAAGEFVESFKAKPTDFTKQVDILARALRKH